MTYLIISGSFLLAAALISFTIYRLGKVSGVSWASISLAGISLIVLTAIFDNIMIALDLFTYSPDTISGVHIVRAPVEDFAYPIAVVVLLPVLWTFLTMPRSVSIRNVLVTAVWVSRPVSWINTAFPFAAAFLFVSREADWLLFVGTLYYLIPYNLAMYGVNDVFDYDSDLRNPRKGGIEGALMLPEYQGPILWLVLSANLPFLLLLGLAGNRTSMVLITASTFFVVAYSLPRLRFKERPFIDSVTSSLHFVSPAVVGITLAGGVVDSNVFLCLVAFLMWGIAAHAFGAVQDIRPDREAGIGSIATFLGARWTVRFSVVLWGFAGLLLLNLPGVGQLVAFVVVPYMLNGLAHWNLQDSCAERANRSWRRFIYLNMFSGFLITLLMIQVWFRS